VVFRLEGLGNETVLYSFTGGADGGGPNGVVLDSAGNFYGTTFGGGSAGAGVVFKLDTKGNETVLYSFTGGADGGNPLAGVVLDSAGNLYGTTYGGGSASAGVVFKLDTKGNETVLYSFTGGADGGYPFAGVVLDSAGNLYGTTSGGGSAGAGVVFKLDTKGNETVLYSFTGGADGGSPFAGVVLDSAGNLYGTTNSGGNTTATKCLYFGCGVVFKVDQSGIERVLHAFNGADGSASYGALIQDSAGNLYGTTGYGGPAGNGVVFKVDPAGHETVLFAFPGTDGSNPLAGVIQDSAGNLYGTTTGGGVAGAGVVYKLDPVGNETVLYNFTGGADGGNPYGGVILDAAGNLYGTTNGGGVGAGVVFKLDPSGHETVLYSFTGGADGANPTAGLIRDAAGNLYGTTNGGGLNCFLGILCGTVFKLDPSGHETVLHSFAGGADGINPWGGVVLDSAGNLYGTTSRGGSGGCFGGCGTVFKLDPGGNETLLYSFTFHADGGYPLAGVILDAAGNIYGNTYGGGPAATGFPGVVYKVDPAGHETVLYGFAGTTDGNGPRGNMFRDSAGNLYGATEFGGSTTQFSCGSAFYGCGVVFKVDTTGHETVLYTFGSGGVFPRSGVTGDSAGNLYGTTASGGAAGSGVVFKIDPAAEQPAFADPPPPPKGPPFPGRPLPPQPTKGPLSIPSKGM
jgi:uncharacterized repeat protein (TIGR03803 family)